MDPSTNPLFNLDVDDDLLLGEFKFPPSPIHPSLFYGEEEELVSITSPPPLSPLSLNSTSAEKEEEEEEEVVEYVAVKRSMYEKVCEDVFKKTGIIRKIQDVLDTHANESNEGGIEVLQHAAEMAKHTSIPLKKKRRLIQPSASSGGKSIYCYMRREEPKPEPQEQMVIITFMDTSESFYVPRTRLEYMSLRRTLYIPSPLMGLFFGMNFEVNLYYNGLLNEFNQSMSNKQIHLLYGYILENRSDFLSTSVLPVRSVVWRSILVHGLTDRDVNPALSSENSFIRACLKEIQERRRREKEAADRDATEESEDGEEEEGDNYGVEEIRVPNPKLFGRKTK